MKEEKKGCAAGLDTGIISENPAMPDSLDDGNEVDLTAYSAEIEDYIALGRRIGELRRRRAACAEAIKAAMGDAGYGSSPSGEVVFAACMKESFDSERLRRERPEIYGEYAVAHMVREFRVLRCAGR